MRGASPAAEHKTRRRQGGAALQSDIRHPTSDIPRRAVVVSFDQLHSGFLGCCGNDWIETPNFDRLAAEAVFFDQHFCENLDPGAANHAWWTGQYQFPLAEDRQGAAPAFVEALRARAVRSCLIAESDGRDGSLVAPPFDEVLTVRGADGFDVAESDTPFACVVRRCDEWLRESAGNNRPALLWIKSRGVPIPWVPPQDFAELYLAEFGLADEAPPAEPDDDQEFEASPPASREREGPQEEADGSLDWRYAAAMYAAYMTLIDRWLGVLLETLRESPGWEDALLIVTAAAGQELGEHGPLGEEALLLRSESAQSPLWVCIPGSDQRGTRRQALVQTIDLPPTLREWFAGGTAAGGSGPAADAPLAGHSLLAVVRNEAVVPRPFVVLGTGRAECGIRTPTFFYVEPGDQNPEPEPPPPRLFEKPHDRWDQSDVLSQYPQVAEELQRLLRRQIDELTALRPG
jgi:arylsulfatase A-like enzyme